MIDVEDDGTIWFEIGEKRREARVSTPDVIRDRLNEDDFLEHNPDADIEAAVWMMVYEELRFELEEDRWFTPEEKSELMAEADAFCASRGS